METILAIKDLVIDRKWAIIVAVIVGTLVRATKADVSWFPFIPSRWRPTLAITLGLLGGAVAAVMHPEDALRAQALADGLMGAMLAISSHGVVIRGARDGKELLEKSPLDDAEKTK